MLKDNILRLCKDNNLTISKLEDELGLARSSITRWDKASPRIDNLVKVADYFGVTVNYLIYGVDKNNDKQVISDIVELLKSYGVKEVANETKKIPIVTTIKCGDNGLAYEDINGYIMVDETLHGNLIAMHTIGTSMIDAGINEGDLAIIRIQEDIESGEIAAVVINGEEATLKRIIKLPVGIALEGANPTYQTRYFMGDDVSSVRIVGKLVEVRKRF